MGLNRRRLRGALASLLAGALCLCSCAPDPALAAQQIAQAGEARVPALAGPAASGVSTFALRKLDLASGFPLYSGFSGALGVDPPRQKAASGQAAAAAYAAAAVSLAPAAVAGESLPAAQLSALAAGDREDPALSPQARPSRPRSLIASLRTLAGNIRSALGGRAESLSALDWAFDLKNKPDQTTVAGGADKTRAPSFLKKAAAAFRAPARLEPPLPARTSWASPWLRPASYLAAGILAAAFAAWAPQWLHPLWFIPILGMIADSAGRSEDDKRGHWQERFFSRVAADVRPGFGFTQAKKEPLLQEGVENGYILPLKESADSVMYLYAVPSWILSLGALNRTFGNLIARGIRSQVDGKPGAALADFLDARRLLVQEIEQSGFHKNASDQEAYALDKRLADILINNAVVSLFRAEIRSRRDELEEASFSPELERSVEATLNSLMVAANLPNIRIQEPAARAEPALSAVAKVLKEQRVPAEVHSPNKRQEYAVAIDGFMQRVFESAHSSLSGEPDPTPDDVQRLARPDPVSARAYASLLTPRRLPADMLAAVAELLRHRDPRVRARAADVLGNQPSLPPEARQALERIYLENRDQEAELRAANLLITDDNMRGRSAAIPFRKFYIRGTSNFRRLISMASIRAPQRDMWMGPVAITPAQVIRAAWDDFDGSRVRKRAQRETFARFLYRALDYAADPLRLMKTIRAVLTENSWESAAMSGQYAEDIFHKLWAERRLLEVMPQFIAAADNIVGQRTGRPSPVAGILVVGSFAGHPTRGSDLNYLWATRADSTATVPVFLHEALSQALGAGERFPSLTVHGTMRLGTLNYYRQIVLGGVYFGPEGRYPEADIADIGQGN